MKIALISDTHGIFREEWVPHITACDYLIHAGDINTKTCYEKFKSLGVPAYFEKETQTWANGRQICRSF